MRTEYIKKLADMMEYDAMLISPSEELRFFTGFSPMMCERFQALFVKKSGECFYLCNTLYADEVAEGLKHQCPVYHWHDNEGMDKAYEILKNEGLEGKTIGVNSTAQAFNVLDIGKNCGITFVNGKPLLEEVRIIKTHEELENMRLSARVADSAFEKACAMIRPGITEAEVRDVIVGTMAEQGGCNFDCIVLDWGCAINEMMSDLSRTVFVGSISDEQRRIYELVDRAQLTAQSTAREGAFIPDIDKAARDVLDEQGYAHTLVNRVGHGIGYSVHEGPYINQINHRHLERGMCFSIEPGVYLGGRFGMRVENIVCINEKGETEVLNKADRSLRILDWYRK